MAVAGATGSKGENITHFTAVRMRVTGDGNLKMRMLSEDEIVEQTLKPFVMVGATNIQPTRLCNFMQQRASLEIKTTVKNEIFKISRIVIFSRETFSSFPG